VSARIPAALLAFFLSARLTASAQDRPAFSGADRETSAALTRIVQAAIARGLPADHIVSKVQFALVVHAPPARILETARAVADRLEASRSAIADDTLSADIAAGEEALSFKISKGILTRIHRAAPNRPIAVPIGLLTQLVANDVPADHAGDIVIKMVRGGATPKQFADLGNDVNSDVQRGARGAESADIRLRGLTPLLSPGGSVTTGDFGATSPAASAPRKP